MTIAIIGGGAMGSLWAARLGLAGEENLWVVEKDEERYAAIEERGGIRFHGGAGAAQDVPVTAVRQIEELPLFDLDGVILAVKAYQVDSVLGELLPLLRGDTPVLCLANGAGFGGESLVDLLPKLGQVFFAVSFQGAYLPRPGEVFARGDGAVFWGSLPPVSQRYVVNEGSKNKLEGIVSSVPGCIYQENFVAELWRKLLVNSVINPLSALWQVSNGGLAAEKLSSEQRQVKNALLQEGLAVAAAYGGKVLGQKNFLCSDHIEVALEETIAATAGNYSSMYQDVVHGRRTEIDFINGYLIEWGEKLGVATPCHKEIYRQIITGMET